jgi:hypothetical protein
MLLLFVEWRAGEQGEVFVMERRAGPCPLQIFFRVCVRKSYAFSVAFASYRLLCREAIV